MNSIVKSFVVAAVLLAINTLSHAQCSSCDTSASIKGSTSVQSRAAVSLSGIGNAYSQSSGTSYARATAKATPGPAGVTSQATSAGGAEGLVFSVGAGNYVGDASYDATSKAGGIAAANYYGPDYDLGTKAVANSGYPGGVGGATLKIAATNGQGVAARADTTVKVTADASMTRSLADCVIELVGAANTTTFVDAATHAGGVNLEGVLLSAGTNESSAASTAKVVARFVSQ